MLYFLRTMTLISDHMAAMLRSCDTLCYCVHIWLTAVFCGFYQLNSIAIMLTQHLHSKGDSVLTIATLVCSIILTWTLQLPYCFALKPFAGDALFLCTKNISYCFFPHVVVFFFFRNVYLLPFERSLRIVCGVL